MHFLSVIYGLGFLIGVLRFIKFCWLFGKDEEEALL